jgi:hypothetical protein
MTRKRVVIAIVVVFVLSQVLGIIIHGFILAGDYKPYYGTLLRSQNGPPPWQAALLPVVHLAIAWALVRIALLVREESTARRGLRVALLGWLLGSGSTFLLWYAEQPWPGSLVLKQLPLELLAMLALGVVAARLTTPAST